MRLLCLLLLCAAATAFAEDSQENVQVTGSRVWPPAGPVTWASPLEPLGPKCAEPTCGGMIDPKEPGGSPDITQKQKDAINKSSTAKIKVYVDAVKDSLKSVHELIKSVQGWLKGGISFSNPEVEVTIEPDGTKKFSASCPQAKIGVGPDGEKKPCIEIKGDPTIILRSNNIRSVELQLTIRVFPACYYEKTCPRTYYTFYAGSERELTNLLNEVIGENYFQPLP
jgi:hypothetical protein